MTSSNGYCSTGVRLVGVTARSAGREAGLSNASASLSVESSVLRWPICPTGILDVDGVPEPRRLANGKLDLRSSKGTSTLARGQMIRDQILAQLHLPNPITFALPDGTTTRVWLATGKDGKKIVGVALWWGVNCAGKAETPIEVVSTPETGPRREHSKATTINSPLMLMVILNCPRVWIADPSPSSRSWSTSQSRRQHE